MLPCSIVTRQQCYVWSKVPALNFFVPGYFAVLQVLEESRLHSCGSLQRENLRPNKFGGGSYWWYEGLFDPTLHFGLAQSNEFKIMHSPLFRAFPATYHVNDLKDLTTCCTHLLQGLTWVVWMLAKRSQTTLKAGRYIVRGHSCTLSLCICCTFYRSCWRVCQF